MAICKQKFEIQHAGDFQMVVVSRCPQQANLLEANKSRATLALCLLLPSAAALYTPVMRLQLPSTQVYRPVVQAYATTGGQARHTVMMRILSDAKTADICLMLREWCDSLISLLALRMLKASFHLRSE
jgi:hypothetical protein